MTVTESESFNASVAAEIRAELARQRLTQLQLTVSLGWDQRYLSRRLTGAVPFSTDDIERISNALRIPLSTLTSPRARAS